MPILLQSDQTAVSVHRLFWDALTSNSDSLALSQLWVCGIDLDKMKIISNRISTDLNLYEPGMWNTGIGGQGAVNDAVLNPKKWTGMSDQAEKHIYLFASGISFIADGLNSSRVGSEHVGAMKGLISDSRLELNAGNITFLESNISFVDGLIRPWMALVGHRSLKDQTLRCDIILYCLEKWSLHEPLHVRKSMRFKNAVPINVDAVEHNYTGDKIIERSVQFAFDRYEMNVYPGVNDKGITSITLTSDTAGANTINAEGVKRTDKPNQSPTVSAEENGYLVDTVGDILANEKSNIPNVNPTPSVNTKPYKQDRKFIIPLKNKYKNNSSPRPKVNKNTPEPNISPVPKVISIYQKEI